MLASEIDQFVADGFIAIRGAVTPDVVRACRAAIDAELRNRGVDPDDARTWSRPVVRVPCPEGPCFAAAGASAALCTAYDALLGAERWRRRRGVGGTVPVRFPSELDPGDAGWHIDGSYDVDGAWWVNVHSRGRGLLSLFVLSDIGDDDAPTHVLVGLHLDVPRVLAPFGDDGVAFGAVAKQLPSSTFERPIARVTGRAGDVFVCHPFLVHRASWPHRGRGPRVIAQPEIGLLSPFELSASTSTSVCAVERAILRGLVAGK